MKLTIPREILLVGKGHAGTFLARDGKKDVLGFFAMACGATEDQLLGRVMLMKDGAHYANDVSTHDLPNIPEDVMILDSTLFYLADMNDAPHLSERDRERLLMEGFEKMNVVVKFVGDYPRTWYDGA